MNEYPFVSIIIPAKNEEKYISRCLDAVIKLNYPRSKYEIIVVDNNSTDNTRDIVKKYSSIILLGKKEGTIGAVRNFGAKHAKGEILAFLDGDSIPDSNWLKVACNYFRNDGSIGSIGFAISEPTSESTWVEKTWYKIGSSSKYKTGLSKTKWLSSFNLILKKNLFYQVGGFNELLETCEDADLGYKMSQISNLIFSDEIRVVHLGNTKTLKELFLKEMWRGKSNLIGLLKSKNKIRDFPSVIVPVIFIFAFISLIAGLFLFLFGLKYYMLIIIASIILISPLFLSFSKQKYFNLVQIIQMSILYFVYFFARGLSIFRLKNRI